MTTRPIARPDATLGRRGRAAEPRPAPEAALSPPGTRPAAGPRRETRAAAIPNRPRVAYYASLDGAAWPVFAYGRPAR